MPSDLAETRPTFPQGDSATRSSVSADEVDIETLRARIEQPGQNVYAILDACDEPRVPVKVQSLNERAVSLYHLRADEQLWAIAPYLVSVDGELLDWIAAELFGTPWGIFLFSDTDLETLRKHFRRFLIVKGPDGRELYFRYYDPRVLPTFLTTCDQQEASEFFGPISAFVVQGDGDSMMQLRPK